MTIWRMRVVGCISKASRARASAHTHMHARTGAYTHIHTEICTIYCFSMVKMFSRRRLIVTSYVLSLSSLTYLDDGGSKLLLYVGNYLPVYQAPYSRTLESY
jgi:hypothetical protein